MKSKAIFTVLAGFTALAGATSAHAQDAERWPRWYLGLTGGYTYMGDEDTGGTTASKVSLGSGFGLGGSIGYLPSSSMPLLNALRFEAEVTFHQNSVDNVHLRNGTNPGGSGSFDSTAYMANVFYDLPTGTQWSPYIGGGIGAATIHLSKSSGVGNTESTDSEFAYQGMAGIGYASITLPNTQWTLGYRYLGTSDAKLGGGTSVQYSTNSVEAGLKMRF